MSFIIIWLICGLIAGFIYQSKGHSGASGFIGGLILGPIGIVLAFFTSPNKAKCPHCAELIQPDAKVCKHCRNSVDGQLMPVTETANNVGKYITAVIIIAVVLFLLYLLAFASRGF